MRDVSAGWSEYLGDGVYARLGPDGISVIVWADRDGERHWIWLDPETLRNLVAFAARLGEAQAGQG